MRGLQVHGHDVDRIEAGARAAIALAGLDRQAAERGMTVVADDVWTATSIVTARLRALTGTGWGIEHRQRVRAHLGTAEVMARVVLLERDRLEEGASGWAQLRLEAPLVARTGDRLVLRSYSPVTTIGGGVVAEARAVKRGRLRPGQEALLEALVGGDGPARVRALLEEASGAGLDRPGTALDAGVPPRIVDATLQDARAVSVGDRAFSRDAASALRDALSRAARSHHQARPLQAGIDPAELRRAGPPGTHPALVEVALTGLLEDGTLVMRRGRVAAGDFQPTLRTEHAALREAVRTTLTRERSAPPRLDALRDRLGSPADLVDLLELMEAEGELVRIEADLFMERAEIERIADGVRQRLGGREGLSPSEFRDVIPLTRQHLIPILEHLDRTGVTVRTGGGRTVPGPGAGRSAPCNGPGPDDS